MSLDLLVVLGTRPEAIKLAPVILEARRRESLRVRVASTGQHREMLRPVFDAFGIAPDVELDIMQPGQSLEELTSRALLAVRDCLMRERPDLVMVQGDTTTAMAAAMAAFYARIPVAHVEAGLRTGDPSAPFPEEFNRRVIGQVAAWHFPPTRAARAHLEREGLLGANRRAIVTGNPGIDSLLLQTRERGAPHPRGWDSTTILVTGHRRESFGDPFREFCLGLLDIARAHPALRIVYPVHLNPNVQAPVRELLSAQENIELSPPLAYRDFVRAMASARLIITDSGGVQEEAPALGVPVLVTRDVTERPEAVAAGAALLVGPSRERLAAAAHRLLTDRAAYDAMARTRPIYGDGRASERIVRALLGEPVDEFHG